MKKIHLFFILISLFFYSCQDENNDSNRNKDIINPLSFSFGTQEVMLYSIVNRIKSNSTYDSHQNYSYFYDGSTNITWPDTLKFNNYLVNEELNFITPFSNGSNFNVWDIVGNSDIPSFKDSVLSISYFDITNLNSMDTFNLSSNLTINYSNVDYSISNIFVHISEDLILSKTILDSTISLPATGNINSSMELNDGSLTIPSSFFNPIDSNRVVELKLILFREKNITVGGKSILLRNISTSSTRLISK